MITNTLGLARHSEIWYLAQEANEQRKRPGGLAESEMKP